MKKPDDFGAKQARLTTFSNKQVVKQFLYIFFSGLVVVFCYWIWLKLSNPQLLPIKYVRIYMTSNHIQPSIIKQILRNRINAGFFALDLVKIKKSMMTLPWVDSVEVRRVWPNQLIITLHEKKPIASWNQTQLITAKSENFKPVLSTFPSELPQLIGPDGSENEVLNKFQQLTQLLSTNHLKIDKLELSKRHAWQLWLSNGIKVIVGRNDVDERFSRFVLLYQKLIGARANQVDYVDLRYSNGLAIRWKKAARF